MVGTLALDESHMRGETPMPERLQAFTAGLADPPEASVAEILLVVHLSRDEQTSVQRPKQTQRVHPFSERSKL